MQMVSNLACYFTMLRKNYAKLLNNSYSLLSSQVEVRELDVCVVAPCFVKFGRSKGILTSTVGPYKWQMQP